MSGSQTPQQDQAHDLKRTVRWLRSGGIGVWAAAALLVAAAGALGSVLGARAVAHSDSANARTAFVRTSQSIASTLNLAIRHQEQLTVSASTYLSAHPRASYSDFKAWARWARTHSLYPELDALDLLTPAHPSPELLLARDGGSTVYRPVRSARGSALAVETPVYRGTATPRSLPGRRAAFVGWLREVLIPGVVLREALVGDPGYQASLSHRGVAVGGVAVGGVAAGGVAVGGVAAGGVPASLLYASGSHQPGGQSASTHVSGGWTVTTFAAPVAAGVFVDGDALTVLTGGVLLSALLGVLVFLLGAPRFLGAPRLLGAPRPLSASRLLGAPRPQPSPAPPPGGSSSERPGEPSGQRLHDPLTGLPGRALTLDRAQCMVARARRQPGTLAGALAIDIDWFAELNDRFGRPAGDQLLQTVAQRLGEEVRAGDTVGRVGADEFVVLVESPARGMRLDNLAARMIEALHKPLELAGFGPSFCLTASIGVAFGRYETAEDLLNDAQLALRSAKAAGKDRYTLFNANMRSMIESRSVLEAELNAALLDGQFFLVYQPIRDLRTRAVVEVEALVRWLHPKQGVLEPAGFLPLAEDTGLIVPIGRWVLEQACARAAVWEVAGHQVGVAVNVSANQLGRDGFITDVRRALQQSGVAPSTLTLQIAEATVMRDVAASTERLRALKRLGVRLAIDGFGSAYAHRADLQRMQLDFLKVDLGSLAEADDAHYRSWLLEAIFIYARELSLMVIAEGVETEEQLSVIDSMGARMAQGPLLDRPASREAVEALFGAGSASAGTRSAPPATAPPAPAPGASPAPATAPPAPSVAASLTPVAASAAPAALVAASPASAASVAAPSERVDPEPAA